MSKPNFVIIFPDMWRGDCLSIAGHPYVKTPYIDDIAQSGVYFDGAYSACPTCIPARVALATGLNSSHNGRLGYRDQVVWRYKDRRFSRMDIGSARTGLINLTFLCRQPLKSLLPQWKP